MMELFHRIDDAIAIVRLKGGTFKQTDVYRRADRVYVKANGGFVRVCTKFGEAWCTSKTDLSVIDMSDDIPGLDISGEPRWKV